MDQVPIYVPIVFLATACATYGFIYFGLHQAQFKKGGNIPMAVSSLLFAWLFIIAILSFSDFFLVFDGVPPRFMITIAIPLISIMGLFMNRKSRVFLKRIPISILTYIHIIRVPIEIILWWLFLSGLVPKLMTFEGVNYDILAGISAPFVAIFLVGMKNKSRIGAIMWNLIALALLFNIVIRAVLSAPFPFQQLAFDTPNMAVFYFPYVWLPAFIVPAVLFAHLVSLLKLFTNTKDVQ